MNQVQILVNNSITSLRAAALKIIKMHFCAKSRTGDICLCKACVAINEKRFPALLWTPPKSSYTRDSIEHIHAAAQLTRPEEETIFCIIENPEFLLPAAANSLLKTLEEPPAHIMFLFLSQNLKSVLPTLASRSTIIFLDGSNSSLPEIAHELIPFFINTCNGNSATGQQLDAILQKKCPDSIESMQIFDQIITTVATQNEPNSAQVLATLYKLRSQPPATGSSKLFWRTAFLNIVSLK